MKYLPIILYVVIVTICMIIPTAESFSTIIIKLLLAQVIAIPCLITTYFLTKIVRVSY